MSETKLYPCKKEDCLRYAESYYYKGAWFHIAVNTKIEMILNEYKAEIKDYHKKWTKKHNHATTMTNYIICNNCKHFKGYDFYIKDDQQ